MTWLTWLANSPIGTALKVGLAAAFLWVIENVANTSLPGYAQVSLIAGLPVLINWLNPADSRYGVNSETY